MNNLPFVVENILQQRYNKKFLIEKEELVIGREESKVIQPKLRKSSRAAEYSHPLRSQFVDAVKKEAKNKKEALGQQFDETQLFDEDGNINVADYDVRNAALKSLYYTPGFADTLSQDEYKYISASQRMEGLAGVVKSDRYKYATRPLVIAQTGENSFESIADDEVESLSQRTLPKEFKSIADLEDINDRKAATAKFVAPAHISYSKWNEQDIGAFNLPQVGYKAKEYLSHPKEVAADFAVNAILGKILKGIGLGAKGIMSAVAPSAVPQIAKYSEKLLGKEATGVLGRIFGSDVVKRQIGSKIVPGALTAAAGGVAAYGISGEAEPIKIKGEEGEASYMLPASGGAKTTTQLLASIPGGMFGYGPTASRVRPPTTWETKTTTIPAEYAERDIVRDVEEPIFKLRTDEPPEPIVPSKETQAIVRGIGEGKPTISGIDKDSPLFRLGSPLEKPDEVEIPPRVGPQGKSFMEFIRSLGQKSRDIRRYKSRERGTAPKSSVVKRDVVDINKLSPEMRAKVEKWIDIWNNPYKTREEWDSIPDALKDALRAQAQEIEMPTVSMSGGAQTTKPTRQQQLGVALSLLSGGPFDTGAAGAKAIEAGVATAGKPSRIVATASETKSPELVQIGTRKVQKVVGKETVKVSDEKVVKTVTPKNPIKTPLKNNVSGIGQTVVQNAAVSAVSQAQALKSDLVAPAKANIVANATDANLNQAQVDSTVNDASVVSNVNQIDDDNSGKNAKLGNSGKSIKLKGKDVPVPPIPPVGSGGGGKGSGAPQDMGRGSAEGADPRLTRDSFGGSKAGYYKLA